MLTFLKTRCFSFECFVWGLLENWKIWKTKWCKCLFYFVYNKFSAERRSKGKKRERGDLKGVQREGKGERGLILIQLSNYVMFKTASSIGNVVQAPPYPPPRFICRCCVMTMNEHVTLVSQKSGQKSSQIEELPESMGALKPHTVNCGPTFGEKGSRSGYGTICLCNLPPIE